MMLSREVGTTLLAMMSSEKKRETQVLLFRSRFSQNSCRISLTFMLFGNDHRGSAKKRRNITQASSDLLEASGQCNYHERAPPVASPVNLLLSALLMNISSAEDVLINSSHHVLFTGTQKRTLWWYQTVCIIFKLSLGWKTYFCTNRITEEAYFRLNELDVMQLV